MKYLSLPILVLFLLIDLSVCAQNWEMVWSDEFNGNNLDTTKWNYETGNGQWGWGTGQIDYCTERKKNVLVKDGKLILTLRKESMAGFDYTAGRLNTHGKYSMKYGKIDFRAKIPAGRGLGAAIWMLSDEEKYGWWPRSGEIDILETNGHEHNRNYGTVHYMKDGRHQHSGHDVITEGNLTTEFHNYTFIWTAKSMKWYLDGVLFNEVNISEPIDGRMPFNEAFYFIVSTGVGSQFSGRNIEDSIMPQTLEVDYLRVYKEYSIPDLVAAKTSLDGSQIELSFSEELKDLAILYKEFILLNKGARLVPVNGALKDRDKRTLIIKLQTPVDKEAELTVSYNSDRLKSVHNHTLPMITNRSVVNNREGASPVLQTARTGGNSYSIHMMFNKALKNTSIDVQQFEINVNQKRVQPASIEFNEADASELILNMTSPFFKEDSILVSYNGQGIQATDAGMLKTFNNVLVENTLIQKFVIPGRIEAEDFLQQNKIASERCEDIGKGKYIKFADDKGWMEYEVYIEQSGVYTMQYRIASDNSHGVIALSVNSKVVNQTSVLSTYDLNAWTTLSSAPVTLKKGIHKIRVEGVKGGFNLNWINFITN